MSKIEKIIIYCIFGSIPTALLVIFILSMFFGKPTKQIIIERDSLETVNGVVDSLFNDKQNHNVRTAILKNHQTYQILREWEPDIEIGDSLSKKKGSFLLEVLKKRGKKIMLDYRSTLPGGVPK